MNPETDTHIAAGFTERAAGEASTPGPRVPGFSQKVCRAAPCQALRMVSVTPLCTLYSVVLSIIPRMRVPRHGHTVM